MLSDIRMPAVVTQISFSAFLMLTEITMLKFLQNCSIYWTSKPQAGRPFYLHVYIMNDE
jgi:hypothetical protein